MMMLIIVIKVAVVAVASPCFLLSLIALIDNRVPISLTTQRKQKKITQKYVDIPPIHISNISNQMPSQRTSNSRVYGSDSDAGLGIII